MFQKSRLDPGDRMVDESDVIAVLLRFPLKALQDHRKILMAETCPFIREQDPEIIGLIGLQSSGGNVGSVTQFQCGFADFFLGRL